jgi:tetratricopeptide (TPR) repeat protein
MTRRRASDRAPALAAVVGVGLALLAAGAASQTLRQRAEAVLRSGNQHYDRGDFERALESYREAQELFPSYKIDYNIGVALQALKRPIEALTHFRRFLGQARGRAEAAKIEQCKRRIARLRDEVCGIRLTGAPPGADVHVDGKPAGLTPLPDEVYLMPGSHSVEVTAAGYLPFEQSLPLDAGDHPTVTVRLRTRQAVAPRAALVPPPPAREPRRRVWSWVLTGAAAAALGVAVTFSVLAKNAYDDYLTAPDLSRDEYYSRRSSIEHKELAANISYGVAGALAVGAVVLFFVEPRLGESRPPARGRGALRLQLGQGVSLAGSF